VAIAILECFDCGAQWEARSTKKCSDGNARCKRCKKIRSRARSHPSEKSCEANKIYKREWARNRRQDPVYRAREVDTVMRYHRSETGRVAKKRADTKYRKTHLAEISAKKLERYHELSAEEKSIRNRRYNWRTRYGIDPIPLASCCAACGTTDNLELDHMYPVSKGGTSDPSNLWTLCRRCNAFKSDRLITTGQNPGVMVR